jgi:ABC-2 type transport system permease protein
VLVALLTMLTVVRHTRADEEVGRRELLAAGSVGRYAPLAAAVAVAGLASVAVGLLTAIGLVAVELPVAGSLAFGLMWTVAGLAFTGVGAVVAQMTTTARAARGLGAGALAVAFLLRAAGDSVGGAEPAWPTWLSPIGWSQQVRPYAGDRWAFALLPIALAVLLIGAAAVLLGRRDMGAGLLPARAGADRANSLLAGPMGLAWRIQRAGFIGWLIAFVVLSLVLGQILSNIGDMLDTPVARQFIVALGGVRGVTDAFLSLELTFVAVAASVYGISCVLRLSHEESAFRGDLVLATATSRTRWAASHVTLAVLGTSALMLTCGAAVGLAHALQSGDDSAFARDLAAAAVRLPAVFVMIAIAVLLLGLSRRAAVIAWGALLTTFLLTELGILLDLPAWVVDLSPFTHVPALPGGEVTSTPILVLLAASAALTIAGLARLSRRDIAVA